MELDDCAFPLLAGIDTPTTPTTAFGDVDVRAARRRPPAHARAWSAATCSRPTAASSSPRARPSTTTRRRTSRCSWSATRPTPTALIAMSNAPDVARRALHRHDPPRPQPGDRAARRPRPARRSPTSRNMTIWGNHSATQYPDIFHAKVERQERGRGGRRPGLDRERLHPDRAEARRGHHRGPRRFQSPRRRPTPPSTTCTTGSLGTAEGDWVSMAHPSDGSYGVPEGLISSFPCTTSDGATRSCRASTSTTSSAARIDATVAELRRSATRLSELGLV